MPNDPHAKRAGQALLEFGWSPTREGRRNLLEALDPIIPRERIEEASSVVQRADRFFRSLINIPPGRETREAKREAIALGSAFIRGVC